MGLAHAPLQLGLEVVACGDASGLLQAQLEVVAGLLGIAAGEQDVAQVLVGDGRLAQEAAVLGQDPALEDQFLGPGQTPGQDLQAAHGQVQAGLVGPVAQAGGQAQALVQQGAGLAQAVDLQQHQALVQVEARQQVAGPDLPGQVDRLVQQAQRPLPAAAQLVQVGQVVQDVGHAQFMIDAAEGGQAVVEELLGLLQAAEPGVADPHHHLQDGHIGVLVGQRQHRERPFGQLQGILQAAPLAQGIGLAALEDGPLDDHEIGVRAVGMVVQAGEDPLQQDIQLIEIAQQQVGVDRLAQHAQGRHQFEAGEGRVVVDPHVVVESRGEGRGMEMQVADLFEARPVEGAGRPPALGLSPARIPLSFEVVSHQPHPSASKWIGSASSPSLRPLPAGPVRARVSARSGRGP